MFGSFLQSMYDLFGLIGKSIKQLINEFMTERKNWKSWFNGFKSEESKGKIKYLLVAFLIFVVGILSIILM